MIPVYIRGAAKEYLDTFGEGETTENMAVLLYADTGKDPEPLYRMAIDRGEPLSDQEIIDGFLDGSRERFDRLMAWYRNGI